MTTIKKFIAQLSIGKRIGFAVTVLFMFLAAMALINLRQSSSTTRSVETLSRAFDDTAVATQIEKDAREMERLVQRYIESGIESIADRIEALGPRLSEELQELADRNEDQETDELIERMQYHLGEYSSGFVNVKAERTICNDLIDSTMKSAMEKIESSLSSLWRDSVSPETAAQSQTTRAVLMESELLTLQYFSEPSTPTVSEAKDSLRRTRLAIARSPTPDSATMKARDMAIAAVNDYERAFIRAVQATRAYLYFVGVVLSGQANEFRTLTGQLRHQYLERSSNVASVTKDEAAKLRRFGIIVSLIALVIGSILGAAISIGISRPITALTRTFSKLAAGEDVEHVPGIERRDEIGKMAAAANVFRERNRDTEDLLDKSRRLSEDLEQSNEELNHFVHTVSHDLKSPLVTTMGYIGMIRELTESGDHEEAIEILPRLEKPNRRMNQLISDLLNLSRIGRLDFEKQELDLHELVDEILEDHRKVVEESKVSIVIGDDLPRIYGNRTTIAQVLENLIGNALKYGCDGEHPELRIEATAPQKAGYDAIAIRDNGQGIAPDYHTKIFELFQRLEVSSEGTGIGLSIVQKVMKSHGGQVEIESDLGKGAAFFLYLPKIPQLEKSGGLLS